MSFSKKPTEKVRSLAMGVNSTLIQGVEGTVHLIVSSEKSEEEKKEDELLRLRTENKVLTAQLLHTRELLEDETALRRYMDELEEKDPKLIFLAEHRPLFLKDFLHLKLRSIPGRVFYRSPDTWNSSLWIDVGTEDTAGIVAKNSPVLSGDSVIGVIDYAGTKQSRVRLITDSGLSPSVRAVRNVEGKVLQLAKGELRGTSSVSFRGKKRLLQGAGFNYDFADAAGPARDLRTGEPLSQSDELTALPIIQNDDLLVTTGMDGVFPPGLSVARVVDIRLLKEGDYTYTLYAEPTASRLEDLSLVFVIPPCGFDPDEHPPHFSHL